MQPRQIGILAVAVIAAFAVAFGIGKAAGGDGGATPAKASAASGTKALKLAPVKISSTIQSGAAVPALRAAPKKHKPKKTSTPAPDTSGPDPTATPETTTTTTDPVPTAVATAVPTAAPPSNTPDPNDCADCGGQGGSGGVGEG